uniref:Uncharacterized protein n=1 Tax=Romanomermis culicivorax TaxID=13658 RepID=A0A915IEU1_ROMCU
MKQLTSGGTFQGTSAMWYRLTGRGSFIELQQGCSSALVVKLADTQKDKELKKSNVANPLKSALTTPAGLSGLSLGQPCSANPLLSLLQTVGLNSLNTLTLQQQLALLASNATTTSNIPNVPNLPNWLNTDFGVGYNSGINPNLMQNLPALTLLNSFSGTNRSSTLNSGQQSIVNNANFSLYVGLEVRQIDKHTSLMPGNNALLSALPMAHQQSSPSFFANNAAAIGNAATGDACSQLSGINQN